MITPEGALPGQTINIVVPEHAVNNPSKSSEPDSGDAPSSEVIADPDVGIFGALVSIGQRTVAHAKNLDDTYQITNKVVEIASPGLCIFFFFSDFDLTILFFSNRKNEDC